MPRPASRVATAIGLIAMLAACGSATTTAPPASQSPSSVPTSSASAAAPTQRASATPARSPAPSGPFDPAGVSVSLEPVVDGLDSPLAVVHAGDGSGRLWVAEQGGTIRVIRDGSLVEAPFLDISDRILSGGERGLLGLAFHPDYPEDPRFFVNYTDREGHTQIASYEVDPAEPDRAAQSREETRIITIRQPYANHNGGALAFGPDGYLYIATGDGGSGGDPHGFGQSLETLLGKIVRIDVDTPSGGLRYSAPADNPFLSTERAKPEIWHYGLRNPWRMSFDRATGDLWIGDVGQSSWEEVDVARAGRGGLNFGWNRMEGNHCFRPQTDCEGPELTLPAAEYGQDTGGCTVIGGYVYRGSAEPALAGGYLFADYCSGLIWAIDAAADGPVEPVVVAETDISPSAFGEDEVGELYVTDISGGVLLRVGATGR